MVGPVVSSPVQSGQTQNAIQQTNQQTQQQGNITPEQQSPRDDDVQSREAPAAQTLETRADNRTEGRSIIQQALDEATDPQLDVNQNDNQQRGQTVDFLV